MQNALKLMNDDKYWSLKLVKLKCSRGDQLIQTFCIIGSSEKLGPSSLISTSFKTLGNVFLNDVESIEIY